MRHLKHRHQLGVKKEHREAIMASLSAALFRHDRIETTLGYAKALRPFAEKIITLAKKAAATDDTAKKLHFRRLALAKVRDESAVHFLFADKVKKFEKREGGYLRIYKLVKRTGDAADMAIIEMIEADDEGYKKASEKKAADKKAPAKKTAGKAPAPAKKTASNASAATDDAFDAIFGAGSAQKATPPVKSKATMKTEAKKTTSKTSAKAETKTTTSKTSTKSETKTTTKKKTAAASDDFDALFGGTTPKAETKSTAKKSKPKVVDKQEVIGEYIAE